ncbi:hypothetical protein TWF730_008727 [Orbilia blumenaviensis]|uniref:PNPLA domain-containing protein n=1 Tax=Orbilia blumenaviensis TaxID=1796055 RepID=A0AAV9V681_9PEZI
MDFGGIGILPSPPSAIECGKCEARPGTIACNCGEHFCVECFHKSHLRRNPTHRKKPDEKYQVFWNHIRNYIPGGNQKNHAESFKKDEAAKWFGLDTRFYQNVRVSVIVDTLRLTRLLENSRHANEHSPSLQFPSITSFVGPTGAGKSVIIRTLIYHSTKNGSLGLYDAPVPGACSGDGLLSSTTGEVNLYSEPSTFGTRTPLFFADCEGIMGSEPLASNYQIDWTKGGRKYRIQKPMDRRTAVKELYPRFLYIFSDVICYVTREYKSWAEIAIRLLEWSSMGAQSTINQYALPALVIILNAPGIENETWVSDDTEAMTRDFFLAIEKELHANDDLRALAAKNGDTSMSELFKRSYSSVYVHYIPFSGNGKLGGVDIIHKQTARLLSRIKSDTDRVQLGRAKSLSRFDSRQLPCIADLAFKHLATNTTEPFDFGQYKQHTLVPETLPSFFGEYLQRCFKSNIYSVYTYCAETLGSAILNNALAANTEEGTIFVPSVVFNTKIRDSCQKAMDLFRDENVTCAYIDPGTGYKCVNTKLGHTKGHQDKSGTFMRSGGSFVEEKDGIDTAAFIALIENYIDSLIRKFSAEDHSNQRTWRRLCAEKHQSNIRTLRLHGIYPQPGRAEANDPFSTTAVCYGCLFRPSVYLLPCGHAICELCVKANSEDDDARKYNSKYTVKACVICGTSTGPQWPYVVRIRPSFSGLRILSLDGGGVRGIIQLIILQRLESHIGLGLPIGDFFDLIVGTSTGGITALSLGVQASYATDFVESFKDIWKTSFSNQQQGLGFLHNFIKWWWLTSVYFTENVEEALQACFQRIRNQKLFGLRNHCRVAVTTTVDSETKLIANYQRGGTGKYLSSDLSCSDAARCTSAAPPYFSPKMHDGILCRDGGLKESNPVHTMVTESQRIWGEAASYDMILSVGSGEALKRQPDSRYENLIEPGWVKSLFGIFLNTMNGQEAWTRFKESSTADIVERSSRLNVFIGEDMYPKRPGTVATGPTPEPAFDDLKKMEIMEAYSQEYTAFEEPVFRSSFAPTPANEIQSSDVLRMLANRLRASLFFLHIKSVDKSDGFIIVVKGAIRCRLGPSDPGFTSLSPMVTCFRVGQETIEYDLDRKQHFDVDITFSHESVSEPIRIDVKFGGCRGVNPWVAISGCPITIKKIMEEWDSVDAQNNVEESRSQLPGHHESAGYDKAETQYTDSEDSLSGIDVQTLRTDDFSDSGFDANTPI